VTPFLLWLNVAIAGDAASTHAVLAHGGREAGIFRFTQNPWVLDGLQGGVAASETLGLRKLRVDHPKAARVLGWTLVGLKAYGDYENLRVLRREMGR
jgi:hypothetical protein